MYDLTLINTKIITPIIEIKDGFLVIKDKLIHFIGDNKKDSKELKHFLKKSESVIDVKGKISVPGFIDIHTHGALGKDYTSSPELIIEDAKFRATRGVTGFLPTIGAMVSASKILSSASRLVELTDNSLSGAQPLGINLEGPFLHPDYAGGAGPDNCLEFVDIDYLRRAKEIMGDLFKIITISPELENALEAIAFLRENGTIVSIGHTNANNELLDKAIRRGADLVTHIFDTAPRPELVNGLMTPGVDEYLMLRDDVMVEAICDIQGIHIKPLILQMLLRCKGIDKIIIITDSFMTPGTEQSEDNINFHGHKFVVREGVNIIPDPDGPHRVSDIDGQICGSAMTMDLAIKSMISHTGVDLKEAVQMASSNPAKLLNMNDKKGSIRVGKDADISIIDSDLNIYMTIVEGKRVYTDESINSCSFETE